jgi:hypothetical protein
MRTRIKGIVGVSGVALAAYLGTYFLSVRTNEFESHDLIVPEPFYRPWDSDFVQVVFGPAHLIDAGYLRRAHWEPRSSIRR